MPPLLQHLRQSNVLIRQKPSKYLSFRQYKTFPVKRIRGDNEELSIKKAKYYEQLRTQKNPNSSVFNKKYPPSNPAHQ